MNQDNKSNNGGSIKGESVNARRHVMRVDGEAEEEGNAPGGGGEARHNALDGPRDGAVGVAAGASHVVDNKVVGSMRKGVVSASSAVGMLGAAEGLRGVACEEAVF